MKLKHILLVLFLFICLPVYAAEVTTSVTGPESINEKSEFTITLNVTAQNLWGLGGGISYDSSKLTLTKYEGLNSFTAMVGSSFTLDTATGKSGTFGILKLTFKASDTFRPGESTTISFLNMTGANDSSRLTANNTSKTIKVNIPKSSNNNLSSIKVDGNNITNFASSKTTYDLGETEKNEIEISAITEDSKATITTGTGKKTINYGQNKFSITVKAENGNTKTYTIIITKPDKRNTNNYLKSLSITNAKINFNKGTLNYNVIVENKIDKIDIKATAEDTKATITGTGTKTLKEYLNTFNIVVTAENGTTRTYKINISRKDKDGNVGALSTNNKLKTLEVKGYQIDFKEDILKYSLTVENTINKIDINATPSDSNSTIKIDNPEELSVGENIIKIEVTSQSGDIKTYEIIVTRKSDAPIIEIKELLETINKTTAKEIEVEIKNEENIISSKIINNLKDKDLKLKINKYENNNIIYTWTISGKDINKEFDFDTLVKFESNKETKIKELTNYAESINLNYSHSGELPKGTKFKVYVGNKYEEYDLINLYYYDETNNKLILEEKELLVKNGYVEFDIEHCSEYILTQANFIKEVENKNFDYKIIIIIIETLIILGLTTFILLKFIKKRKNL